MDFKEELRDLRPIFDPVLSIQMTGQITQDDPDRLRRLLAKYDGVYIRNISVSLDSPGGNLFAGMEMGRILNDRSELVSASVGNERDGAASCASACVFLYLGADYRYLSGDSRLGVHQFSSSNPDLDATMAMSSAQKVSAIVVSYIQEMRADPQLFNKMSSTPSEGINWLSREDLSLWNVVTGSVYSESAEYHNLSGKIALKMEHVSLNGRNIMTLFCSSKGIAGAVNLHEPPLSEVGHFEIVIDGEGFPIDEFNMISSEGGRSQAAFRLPAYLRDSAANARTFGARIVFPSGEIFYGFEQNIRDKKLKETVEGCELAKEAAAVNSARTADSLMTVYLGYDINGKDLMKKGIRNISFEQCQRECLDSQYCQAVSYVVSKRWCWPKSGVASSTKRSGVVSATRN